MNPPHILIARNSRGGPNSSASLSTPTETHAAAAGIFRSTPGGSSPPWYLEECESADEIASALGTDSNDYEDPIELDATFTRSAKFPGTVKIIVETTTFWAHKEVLYFASSFFQAALSGEWAESAGARSSGSGDGGGGKRPMSMSSVITISQPRTTGGTNSKRATLDPQPEMTFAPIDPDLDPEEIEIDIEIKDGISGSASASAGESDLSDWGEDEGDGGKDKEAARKTSLSKLESSSGTTSGTVEDKGKAVATSKPSQQQQGPHPVQRTLKRRTREAADAVIVLKEEKASTFHDFLKYVYPHLVCTITWNNVEGLLNISHKLHVPSLQTECLTFLLTHAAGRPIKAMRIAELFDEEELYREASRFVLDNPGGWSDEELGTLSGETLLKLEKRRTWFLERVLKLGLVAIAKEYQCCPTCPDSNTCARLLEEKWRQAYHAVFRFGPCQPSMVFRYLRTLEGISPPLSLTHLSCQTTAKAFVATLFDRMFSLGVRGSGTDAVPLGARVAAAAAATATSGPRRHFLYCSLKGEQVARGKRSREVS